MSKPKDFHKPLGFVKARARYKPLCRQWGWCYLESKDSTHKRNKNNMAAPITTTATTAEGQLLQIIEGITNLQVAAINAAGANAASVRRMITQNVSDDIAGTKTVTISIPINVEVTATGTGVTAAVVYA